LTEQEWYDHLDGFQSEAKSNGFDEGLIKELEKRYEERHLFSPEEEVVGYWHVLECLDGVSVKNGVHSDTIDGFEKFLENRWKGEYFLIRMTSIRMWKALIREYVQSPFLVKPPSRWK